MSSRLLRCCRGGDGVAGDLTRRDYWRDDRDRIKAWEKGFNLGVNPRENGRGDRYQYDDAGQLTQAAYQAENAHDTAGTAERTDAFQYDEMGNRTGANWVASRGLMKFGGRNNKLNQYGSWENNISWPDPLHWGLMLWYDDAAPEPAHAPWLPPGNGVLMGDGWNVAGFNALNQPVQMTSFFYEGTGNWMWFGYDPLGRCVKRWVGPGDGSAPNGANYLYYDGWNLVQEGLSANSVARTYVHGARVDEIVASAGGGGPWLYHQYDARGHCIMLTNGNGGIQEQYEYDAFGQPYIYDANSNLVARNLGSPVGNRFLFTGREWLKELRVYDYRNRLYQPELGRFVQPDPKEFEAGDYNLYRYCHNDPVNKSDPFGLRQLAEGVIDVDDEALKKTYDNAKQAAKDSLKDTNRRTQTERRIDTYRGADGKVHSTGETRGFKYPSPQAAPPKLPGNLKESARLSQAHDHVGGLASHYGGDKGSANDVANPNGAGLLPLASSVSSTVDGGLKQEFYIPSSNQADRAANTGGAFFTTTDGINFTPAPYH